jgi:hypothetical protein
MHCDALIIGGGSYGLRLAEWAAGRCPSVVLAERRSESMQHASFNNQARAHNGYHYPRSILTAVRTRANFHRFAHEFRPAIDSSFERLSEPRPAKWTTLSLTLSVLFGIAVLMLSLIGAYLSRVFEETSDRPLCHVRDALSSAVVLGDPARRNVLDRTEDERAQPASPEV